MPKGRLMLDRRALQGDLWLFLRRIPRSFVVFRKSDLIALRRGVTP